MKSTSFLLTLATEHTIWLYLFVSVGTIVGHYFLNRLAVAHSARHLYQGSVTVLGILSAVGLKKWCLALGTVAANYHPGKNFFVYTDHYKDAALSYLLSFDVLPWALCFYGSIAALIYLAIKFCKINIESKFLRHVVYGLLVVLILVTTLGITLPGLLALAFAQARKPKVTYELLRGREVILDDSAKGIAKLKQSLDASDLGVHIHPKVRVPRNLENQHLMIVGCTGSGKTNAIAPVIADAHRRGDKLIAYDVKRDFTAVYAHDPKVMLLTPFDARSKAWNIAKDIQTELDADELGKALFPAQHGKEDFFALAGQNVTKSALLKLIAENGETWGFKELAELFSSKQYIMTAVKQYMPASSQIWGSETGKQADGVFGEIRTRLSCFDYFAKAWPESHVDGISIREWLDSSNSPNMILVQGNSKYSFVDAFFTTLLFTYLFKQVQAFTDNPSRRVWAVIDEFSSLPAIPNFGNTLRLARSKGLCLVLSMQDFGGIERNYADQGGKETLVNNISTKIIGSLLAHETANYLSNMIGTNDYLRRVHIPFLKKGEHQPHPTPETKPAIPSSAFGDIKLPNLKRAAEFFIVLQGAPVVKLKYPIVPLPKISKDFIEADWMLEVPKAFNVVLNRPERKNESALGEIKKEIGSLAQESSMGFER